MDALIHFLNNSGPNRKRIAHVDNKLCNVLSLQTQQLCCAI